MLLRLRCDIDKGSREIYERNIHSDKYAKLINELSKNSGQFEFLPGIKESPWRIAVLRISLYDVLYGKYSQKEQLQALRNVMIDGINRIIMAWNC